MDIIALETSTGLFPIKNIQSLEIETNTQGDSTISMNIVERGNEAIYNQLIEDALIVVNNPFFVR